MFDIPQGGACRQRYRFPVCKFKKQSNDVKYVYIYNQMTILVATTRNNSEHFQLVKSCQ